MANTGAAVPEEQRFILSNLSPSLAQTRLALAVALALLVAFVITAGPLGAVQPGRVDAFVPAFATAMFVNDLITAVLLFAQFSILRSRALLVIASGYLFTALVIIPWLLTFPGVFAPGGLLGAGLQSTNWIYILWHGGFPTCVMAYALLKDADPAKRLRDGSVGAPILSSVAVTMAVVCAATFLVTAGDAYLPRISLDPVHFSTLWLYVAGCLVLWSVLTLIVLWMRRRSVLDLWLMVVMCAYAIEIYLVAFPGLARFSLGWYFGRVFSFMSGSLVLFVLIYEITILYGQLLRAVLAQHHERGARLTTGDAVAATIAHEVKQPLSAMVTNAGAGLRWLDRSGPDLEEAKAAFKQIAADGRRAGAVIESIRAIFKRDADSRSSLDITDLIGEALVLVRGDLQKHRIAVQADSNEQLPWVRGNRVQLQQVLVNLITNAIDSMAGEAGPRNLSIKSEIRSDGDIVVSVADTGKGIRPQDLDRIFNPLFTTKLDGMGMGLSICVRSSRPTTVACRSPRTRRAARCFALCCLLRRRCPPPRHQQVPAIQCPLLPPERSCSGKRDSDPPLLVGVSAVISPEKLSTNERIGIAADDAAAGDHIGWSYANARTESVIRISLSIVGGNTGFMSAGIGCGNGMMPARVTSRMGGLGGDRERRERADETNCNRVRRCRVHRFTLADISPLVTRLTILMCDCGLETACVELPPLPKSCGNEDGTPKRGGWAM